MSWTLPIHRPPTSPLASICPSHAHCKKLWHSSTPTWQRVEFEADFSLLGGCQVSQMPQDAKASHIRSSMRSYKEQQGQILVEPHPQLPRFTRPQRKKVLMRLPRWLMQKSRKPLGSEILASFTTRQALHHSTISSCNGWAGVARVCSACNQWFPRLGGQEEGMERALPYLCMSLAPVRFSLAMQYIAASYASNTAAREQSDIHTVEPLNTRIQTPLDR